MTKAVANEDGELIINEEQAKVVSDIFRSYLDGVSVLGVIKKLAEARVTSPSGKVKWNKRAIETMLASEHILVQLHSWTQIHRNINTK